MDEQGNNVQLDAVKRLIKMEDTDGLPFAYLMLAKGGYPKFVEQLERKSHITLSATGQYEVPAFTAEDVQQVLAYLDDCSYDDILNLSKYDPYLMESLSDRITLPASLAEWLGVNTKLNAEHLATMYINLMDDYVYATDVNSLNVPSDKLASLRTWMFDDSDLGDKMDDLLAIWNGCYVVVA